MNIPIGPTLQIFFVLGIVMVIAFVALLAFRRNARKSVSSSLDFSMFSPGELERLKGKGLLSEEEARRVRSIVTERSIEAIEQARKAPEEPPPDLNSLLAEAERYRREYSNESESPHEEPE